MIEVEVSHADGSIERHTVEAERITIGRSEVADVTVSRAPELADLHLLVIPRRGGFWASPARDTPVRPTLGGRELGNETVPWGEEIDIGSIRVKVRRFAPQQLRGRVTNHRTLVLAALTALALALTVMPRGGDEAPTTSAKPPALFADSDITACPEPDRALNRAREADSAAINKEARYSFNPRNGVAAVVLYEVASRCFAEAGQPAAEKTAAARRDRLRDRIVEDYKTRRVLLDRARDAKDYRELLRESRQLRSYVDHVGGDYRQWLVRMERYAEARIEHTGKKKKKK